MFLRISLTMIMVLAAGCAAQSGSRATQMSSGAASTTASANWEVLGTPASDSKFAKLQPGMSHAETEALIGPPDDVTSYQTGKAWIPFYYGKDTFRLETYYKGEGRLTYSGSIYGNMQGKLIRVAVDTAEDGRP